MQTNRRPSTNPHSDTGQTLAEYSLLIAAIAVVVAVAVPALGSAIPGLFSAATSAL